MSHKLRLLGMICLIGAGVLPHFGKYLLDTYTSYIPGGMCIWLSGVCAALFSVIWPEKRQKKSAQRGDGPN